MQKGIFDWYTSKIFYIIDHSKLFWYDGDDDDDDAASKMEFSNYNFTVLTDVDNSGQKVRAMS